MEQTKRRKAIIFVRILPVEIYFCGLDKIRDYRVRTLLSYCHCHNIEVILECMMISEYEDFRKDILFRLQHEASNFVRQADLFILHHYFEFTEGNGGWLYHMEVEKMGLEVVYISDFAISIGRY